MIKKLQAIVNPHYKIDFPPLPASHSLNSSSYAKSSTNTLPHPSLSNSSLLDVLKRCLLRNPKERLTIPELLNHRFLYPDKVSPPSNSFTSTLERSLASSKNSRPKVEIDESVLRQLIGEIRKVYSGKVEVGMDSRMGKVNE